MANSAYPVYDFQSYDSFSRLRVSQDQTVFESKLLYDTEPLYWDHQMIDSNNVVITNQTGYNNSFTAPGTVNLTIAASASAPQPVKGVRQTYQRFGHQSGKSHLIFLSGILEAGNALAATATTRIGIFDDNDGIFIQASPNSGANAMEYSIVKRSSAVVETSVNSSIWYINTGTSTDGALFSPTNIHTFYISYNSTGSQDITFGILVGGRLITLYTFFNNYKNNSTTSQFVSPNLPIRYEVGVTAFNPSQIPSIICMGTSVVSEGGNELKGMTYMIDRNSSRLNISQINTIYPALICKLQSTSKSTNVFFDNLEILPSSQDILYKWYIYANPVISLTSAILSNGALATNRLITPGISYTYQKNRIEYEYVPGNNSTVSSTVSVANNTLAGTVTTTSVITNTHVRYTDELLLNGGDVLLSGFSKGNATIDLRNTNASKYSLGFSINNIPNILCIGIETINPVVAQSTDFNVAVIVRETM